MKNHISKIVISVLLILLIFESIQLIRYKSENNTQTENIVEQSGEYSKRFDEALAEGDIEVWFQPIIDPISETTIAAEGLSRWKDGDSYISPGLFISELEESGQIGLLDLNVFEKACAFQKERLDQGKELFPISVNLSTVSVKKSDVVSQYKEVFEKYGLPVGAVSIEITESEELSEEELVKLIEAFHANGFPVELDDFGSAYANYGKLAGAAYDVLKIDKSLIDKLGSERGDILVRDLIVTAKDLKMKVIAEGAETAEQVELLKAMGCDAVQGYYYSKPLPLSDFLVYLEH